MNHLPSHLKTGAAYKNRPQRVSPHALVVSNGELGKHDNWSAGFHNALNTPAGDPEQMRVFQSLMSEMGVRPVEVERALMQSKSPDDAVTNVMRLVLKRSKASRTYAGQDPAEADRKMRGALELEQLQNIEALVRSLAVKQTGKEQATADRASKRVAHLGKISAAESMANAVLAV